MATGGLYGTSTANSVVATSGAESTGLYGNATQFGGSYFEWFIFQVADLQPATPTGGSWDFNTNSGIAPAGWSSLPPTAPTNTVWVSIAVVNSKTASTLTWSAPGRFSYSSGLPVLSDNGSPAPSVGQSDQLYVQLDSIPQTIWFKESGTWTRLTGSSLYVDLTNNQTIAGTKTFSSPITGSVTGTSANVTGIVAVVNGGTGVTTSTGTGSVVLNTSPSLTTPVLSGATVDGASPYLNFTPSAAPTYQEGRLFYDTASHTLCYYNDNTQMTLNIGEENVVRVRNQTGSTIPNGTVVYVNGATGNTPTVSLALANAFATSDIIGVATTNIANNGFGYVTINGIVNGLDTSAFAEGQSVYVSATTPGAFTAVEPVAPNYSVQVGVILRANPSVGTLLVSVQFISTEASHFVGTLGITQGGTGQTTANAAFNALAPSQTGNSGKYLTTDGSNTSWATNPLGTVTSVAATVPAFLSISGSPITTSGTLAIGLSGTALPVLNGGTGTKTSTGSGSVVLSTSPTLVTPLLGTPTSGNFSTGTFTWPTFNQNTTGTAANITATSNSTLTTLGALSLPGSQVSGNISGNAANVTGVVAVANGGTGVTTSTGTGSVVLSTSPSLVTPALGTPTSGNFSTGTFTWPTFNQNTTGTAANVTGVVAIANGGTGQTTRQNAMDALAGAVTSGQYLRGNGADVVMSAIQAADVPTLNQNTTGNAATATTAVNVSGGTANVTTLTASADSAFTSTGAVQLSAGTTGQRPTGAAGKLRFNTTTTEFEGYNGTTWASVGGSAISNDTSTATNLYPLFASATTGTAANVYTSNAQYLFKPSTGELSVKAPRASNGIVVNSATISTSYTIAAGDNAMSAGPVAVNSGITVTVSSGSRWVVI